ncbi:MAG: prevent-host-death protein [Prevotellaceae bacterium]|jgi:hypothetical protein|nr:prevent-host-death protein [Prevotellaceae bacterium]
MIAVSSTDFAQSQNSYFDLLDNGGELLIKRAGNKSYKLVAVPHDDSLMTKAEYFAMVDGAMEEERQGKVTRVSTEEELKIFLDSL